MYTLDDIKKEDQEIASAITDEFERQNSHIELIASENWVSPAVMSAMGSILTNKYAEGYPGRRYYGGCECGTTWKYEPEKLTGEPCVRCPPWSRFIPMMVSPGFKMAN